MKTRHIPLLLLLSGLLVLNLACSDDEEDTITGTNNTPQYSNPVVEAMATEGAVVAQEIMDKLPLWSQGMLGKKDTTVPTFDEGCMCWSWTSNEMDETNPAFTWFRNWNFEVSFFQNEVPQESLSGADKIQAVIGYSYNTIRYQDELNNSNSQLYFNLTVTSTEFSAQSVVATGSGMGTFTGTFTQHGEPNYFNQYFNLSLDQTIPVGGGCPTGSFDMDGDPMSFSIGFDGHPTAHWDYVPGPGQLQEGTLTFNCGK